MGSKMISLDLHGEDELFKLKIMGKWKWIPWTLKKPGNVWQTSTSFRYSYDLFNVFPRHYFIYLFIYSYILRTQSAVVDVWRFPFVAERCKWNLLTFALLWVLWRPRPVCVCSLLDVHKETHLLTVILVDNIIIDPCHPFAVENINGLQSSQPNGMHFHDAAEDDAKEVIVTHASIEHYGQ